MSDGAPTDTPVAIVRSAKGAKPAAEDAIGRALHVATSALPGGGEVRDGQLAMARAVGHAVTSGRHLVVQAGTGTGKSLGYLVPALLSGSKVVVSTATKALQDQLAAKDLPFLKKHLKGVLNPGMSEPFAFAILKGRSNYYCVQKAAEMRLASGKDQLNLLGDDDIGKRIDPDRVLKEVTKLAEWSAKTELGDRSELDFEPLPQSWSAVSVSAGECPGAAKCPSGEACFAEKARKKAAEADVVVVNTHLYGQHVRTGGHVLPEHDLVIFDEAHEVEDIMADSFGVEISAGRFSFLAGRARQVIADLDSNVDLVDAGIRIEAALTPFEGQRLVNGPGAHDSIRAALVTALDRVNRTLTLLRSVPDDAGGGIGPRKVRAVQGATSLAEELTAAMEMGARSGLPVGIAPPGGTRSEAEMGPASSNRGAVRTSAVGIGAGVGGVGGSSGVSTKSFDPDEDPFESTAQALDEADEFEKINVLTSGERVAWVEAASKTRGPVLRIAPIEVAGALAATIWSQITAVFASATIPSNLGPRLGLKTDNTDTLDVGSPFDYATQGMLYCAVHLPDPRGASFEPAMHEELAKLMIAAGGRTLALFTSWKGMRNAAEFMAAHKPALPFRVMTQSDLPKPALTKAFAEDETSCLFATMGFWQGIDVPGRALSLVTIDKLPFARPDEPLLVARREKAGDNAFKTIDLPRAAMLLAQGAGRLIRTSSDRGVVAIMDPRLNTAKSYRYELLAALPPMKRTRDRSVVEAFLTKIVG
jgi:ATP-dependent DNA helicase DinG